MQREHGESCRICRQNFHISFSLFTVATRANARNKRFVKYAHTCTQHTHTHDENKTRANRYATHIASHGKHSCRIRVVTSAQRNSFRARLEIKFVHCTDATKLLGNFFHKILYNHLPRKLSPCQAIDPEFLSDYFS